MSSRTFRIRCGGIFAEPIVERRGRDERDEELGALRARVLERGPEPLVRLVVDDRRVARLVRVRIPLRHDPLRGGDEGVALALGDEHVVGREARLSRVQELRVEDAGRGLVDVEVVADDGR
jgi:hypothetical protein